MDAELLERSRKAAFHWHDDQLPASEMLHFSKTYMTNNIGLLFTEVVGALHCVYGAMDEQKELESKNEPLIYEEGELDEDEAGLVYILELIWPLVCA